ncbi:MAG: A24 family peptidase [Alphaproteobacteria bacterium]|nr:A24 family peptidase [Alphaproteobacteria bacterium]
MNIIFILLLLCAAFCAVMMSIHDWRARIIPDVWLFPFLLIGLLVVGFFPWFFDTSEAIIAAAVGYVLSFGMGIVFEKIKKTKNSPVGLGDVKLLAAGGVWLGVTGLAIALVVSTLLGGIWGLRAKQKFIPFAPFFFAGMICALIALLFLI